MRRRRTVEVGRRGAVGAGQVVVGVGRVVAGRAVLGGVEGRGRVAVVDSPVGGRVAARGGGVVRRRRGVAPVWGRAVRRMRVRLRGRSPGRSARGWCAVAPGRVPRHVWRPSGGRRREGEHPVDLVEVGLALDVRDELPLAGLGPREQGGQVRQAPQEALVVVAVVVISTLVQPLEAPAVELAREGLVLALDEEPGHYLRHQALLVVDLPRPAVGLPGPGSGEAGGERCRRAVT